MDNTLRNTVWSKTIKDDGDNLFMTVKRSEYYSLVKTKGRLQALMDSGVSNWDGYDAAVKAYLKDNDDNNEAHLQYNDYSKKEKKL